MTGRLPKNHPQVANRLGRNLRTINQAQLLSQRIMRKFLDRLFKKGPLVPVVRLSGVIGAVTPLRPGLSLSAVASTLERAFGMANGAVAIQLNSPGGSAVQSRLIFQRIRDLAREKNTRVYMFGEDVVASGGYMIACAGDEIYVDPSSIVGSIGVLYSSFGLTEAIHKLGIERRVHTAGEKKMALDMFQPENPDDIARLKTIQAIIHREFIELVKDRRGRKIESHGDNLFTGEFWSGRQALELGLVDGIMDLRTKMRELYGEKVRLRLVAAERGFLRWRIPGVSALDASMARPAAMSIADDVISAIEARAIWAKFGL
jgi:signal peptide peptidase SppA